MSRASQDNPFTPGYGAVPEVWAGRQDAFQDFEEVVLPRVRRGVYEQARLVTGDRGVGKTVFLAYLEDEARAQEDWPVRVTARTGGALVADLLVALARTVEAAGALQGLRGALRAALERLAGLSAGPAGVEVQLREPQRPEDEDRGRLLAELLEQAARAARERGRVLVVLLDEVQRADGRALADVCDALQQAQSAADVERGPQGERLRHHLPVAAYVAGLPGLPEAIRRAGATFFERARHLDFGLLPDSEVRAALAASFDSRGVAVDAEALDELVAQIGGYPYFLHLIGRQVWVAGDGPVVTFEEVQRGMVWAAADLAAFYGERLRGLGEAQYEWLTAAAAMDEGDRSVGAVAVRLGRTSSRLGSTVASLTARGLVRPGRERGRVVFAVPGLDAHLRRGLGR